MMHSPVVHKLLANLYNLLLVLYDYIILYNIIYDTYNIIGTAQCHVHTH